jgi:hypothetical protein
MAVCTDDDIEGGAGLCVVAGLRETELGEGVLTLALELEVALRND